MKQNLLSELVERIIEAISKVQKVDELIVQQECIDIKDDARRREFRERLDNFLTKLEGQIYSKSESSKNTLVQIHCFLEAQYKIEDSYEEADDNLRNLNIKKLDEALEELRKACRDFEIRSIEEVKSVRSKGLSEYTTEEIEKEAKKRKAATQAGT